MQKTLNIDKILGTILREIQSETRKWLKGRPCSEEAFLNRLTEVLAKTRRTCDIGNIEPYKVDVKQYILHRKGKNQTDKFGSDLAITISIPNINFTKTSLFQLKKSENYKVQLLREQIERASHYTPIKERSFVLIVDEMRGGIKISSINEIEKKIPQGQTSKIFQCEEWDMLSEWIIKWMSCKVGAGNRSTDPMPIEKLLEKQLISDEESKKEELDDITYLKQMELPVDFYLTKTWVKYTFTIE